MRINIAKKYVRLFLAISILVLGESAYAQEEPQVPFKYGLGMNKYQQFCSGCHGQWAKGSDQGSPLIHVYYRSSHHGDESFYRAALQGVRQHHWNFGNMPPVTAITRQDVEVIIPFVRWLQQEAGIE